VAARRPFEDLIVLDMGQIYQGPYAGFLLAMAGAFVIKVEPKSGENLRRRTRSFPFAMLNSNKKCVTVDLKSPDGKALFEKLVAKADVLIENYAPAVMDKLGVGAARLMAVNPRLVYAQGSGYGLSGPDRDLLAMDLTVQAMSGVMSVTGEPDGPPLKAGPAICDFFGGIHLYAGIATALYNRQHSGVGGIVEVSMQEAVFPSMASNVGLFYDKDRVPERTGNRHGGMAVSPYNVYPTKDGGFVAIFASTEHHWAALARAIGRPECADDPRFKEGERRVEHMHLVDEMVEQWTKAHSRDQICEIAAAHRVPFAPVRDLIEVLNDPHMHARGALQRVEHPQYGTVVLPQSPIRHAGIAQPAIAPSRALGADNREIYCEWLGLSDKEFSRLSSAGAI
jgi:CoA:oxalate CoA-transferase